MEKQKQYILHAEEMVLLLDYASGGFVADSETHCFRFLIKMQGRRTVYCAGLNKATGGWECNASYYPTFKKPLSLKKFLKLLDRMYTLYE